MFGKLLSSVVMVGKDAMNAFRNNLMNYDFVFLFGVLVGVVLTVMVIAAIRVIST